MGYSFDRFGTLILPIYNRESSQAPVPANLRLVATAAGAFDSDGSGRSAQQFPHSLSVTALVVDDQRVALDRLRAAVGTRTYLYRRADDDGTIHRSLCRLAALTVERRYSERGYQPVTLQFQQLSAWQGALHSAWTLDSGELFDDGLAFDETSYSWSLSSPSTKTVTVDGNLPVADAVITITAGSATLSNPIFSSGAGTLNLRWTGSIVAGTSLVIDCGALTVRNNGVNAYSGLTLASGHTLEEWLRLEPGVNTLTLTITGTTTGATWGVAFRDRWA